LTLRLSILLLATGTLLAEPPDAQDKKNPISLLPDGSVLKGVLLPRYDKNRKLVGDLKAETMTLIDADRIRGENVLIRFFRPDRTQRGFVKLKNATFDQNTSLLRATEKVEITNDNLFAQGSGLIYAFQTGKGFLIGPATTWLNPTDKSTSMKKNPLHQSAFLLLCLAPSSFAAPPAFLTDEEITAIHSEAEPLAPKVSVTNESTQTQLDDDKKSAQLAFDLANSFIKSSKIETPEPLKVEPDPNATIINCDGGMYFDAEEGILVYLKNVTVKDPRFTLTGANELKIFFDKKEPEKADPEKEKDKQPDLGPKANFGDVRKLVATGAVRILQKGVNGKEPVEASGAILTYDVKKGEIIISGRYPWVVQGNYWARAKKPNLTLRLLNNGSFSTQGEWEIGAKNLNLDGQ
jgi:lipopolysaccharide export system protein LptA